MKIHGNMNLDALVERMGTEADDDDALAMRELLTERWHGWHTAMIPDDSWDKMLCEAFAIATQRKASR